MPLVSSSAVLSSLALFNLSLAYLLLVSPATIARHHTVLIFGGAMHLPPISPTIYPAEELAGAGAGAGGLFASGSSPTSTPCLDAFVRPNGATGVAALLLGLLGLGDLLAVLAGDAAGYFAHWGAQLPVRLTVFFALEAWLYLTSGDAALEARLRSGTLTGLDAVKNGPVFLWAFVMLFGSYWAWSSLRSERQSMLRERAAALERRQRQELGQEF